MSVHEFTADELPKLVDSRPKFTTKCVRCRRPMFSLTLLPVMLLCERCEPDPKLRVMERR